MSLDDEIAATTHAGIGCSVCRFIEGRPDAAEWDQVMGKPVYSHGHRAIWKAMAARGFTSASDKSIVNHRAQRHRT